MLKIFTDTDCDITPELAEQYGLKLISMPYSLNDKEVAPYVDWQEFDYKTFYNTLRKGTLPKTSAISPVAYQNYFEPEFKAGNDILYIHFSKAMSGTFNAMNIAIEDLKEKYPDRKFYTIDTKGISILSLIIIDELAKMIKEGKNPSELVEWANKEVDHFALYFYADDLKFFRRSGRVSNFSGIMGNALGIHPIIHVNQEGVMLSIAKSKGRKGTLTKLVNAVIELEDNIADHRVFITHTDCEDIAMQLGEMLQEQFDHKLNITYNIVNPTIGSHCGPDCVGVAFHAKHR